MATNYANTQNRINNYSQKFGMTNILTDAEKSSYKEFANRIHNNTNNADLFKLYTGSADELTSEQMDIVAWEIFDAKNGGFQKNKGKGNVKGCYMP